MMRSTACLAASFLTYEELFPLIALPMLLILKLERSRLLA